MKATCLPCAPRVHSMVMVSRAINYSFSLTAFCSSGWFFVIRFNIRDANGINRCRARPSRRDFSAPSFSNCACASTVNRVQGIASSRVLRDRLAGQLTNAVGFFLDALERFLDFINRVLIRREQAQGKIAVKIIRAGIGHVQAVTGQFLGGFLGQAAHLMEQLVAQIQQILVKLMPFRLDFPGVNHGHAGLRDRPSQNGGRRRGRWRFGAHAPSFLLRFSWLSQF